MTISTQAIYVMAGLILPVFYIPQILHCVRDNTGLHAFSMSKSTFQLLLRLSMLPFLLQVNNTVILSIALFDIFGRIAEFSVSIGSLRRQKWSWSSIALRLSPIKPVKVFFARIRLESVTPRIGD